MNVGWTDEEINLLREYAQTGRSAGQLSRKIGRSRNAILGRAHRMGLSFRNCVPIIKKKWTADLDEKLATLIIAGTSIEDTSKKMRKSPSALYARAQHLNLKFTPQYPANPNMTTSTKKFKTPDFNTETHEPIDISDLTVSSCRWPFDDADGNHIGYCGAPRTGQSYCDAHAEIAYPAMARLADQKRAKEVA